MISFEITKTKTTTPQFRSEFLLYISFFSVHGEMTNGLELENRFHFFSIFLYIWIFFSISYYVSCPCIEHLDVDLSFYIKYIIIVSCIHNRNWWMYTGIIDTVRTLCYYRTSKQSRQAGRQAGIILIIMSRYMYIKSESKETYVIKREQRTANTLWSKLEWFECSGERRRTQQI